MPGGTLFINSSIVTDEIPRADIKVVRVPVTELALEMGSAKVLNIVMLNARWGLAFSPERTKKVATTEAKMPQAAMTSG